MDCDGLSSFGIPVKTLRSCVVLLKNHYPERLRCLLVVRLPSVARVITQTLFQVSIFDFLLFFTSSFLVHNSSSQKENKDRNLDTNKGCNFDPFI
ncbi:putative CRAL-TRIO lipid binding domain-containing protein [Helianthus anomalus]